MQKLYMRNKGVLRSLCMTAFMMLFAMVAFASHFRGGNISWRKVSGNTIEFKITQAWRNSAFFVPVGQVAYSTSIFDFGDGNSTYVDLTVTAVNSTEDWMYGEYTVTHTYPNTGTYFANMNSCCTITLYNYNQGSWQIGSLVTVGNNNNSPIATLQPIVNVPRNSIATFNVPVNDPDGDAVTFSLASAADLGGMAPPSGLSVNATTGVASFNTNGLGLGTLIGAAFNVTDSKGARVTVDVILKVVQPSVPPTFDYSVTPNNNRVFQVSPGQPVNFTVKAADSDAGDVVTLQGVGLPVGSSMTPSLPRTGNPVQSSFAWTPTNSNLGTNVINFIAQDAQGIQTSTSVVIQVSLKPVFNVPPTPADNSTVYTTAGASLNYTIQASDPDPLDKVQIISALNLPSGASLGSALPTAAGNPTSVNLSWVPSTANWGLSTVTFTAKDTYGDQTTHKVNFVVNTKPYFISTQNDVSIVAGKKFTYNISAGDIDVPYGDVLEIVSSPLPAWLTLTDNEDGTATLTGTPTVNDGGVFTVNLMAEDTYHHNGGTAVQTFKITVVPCDVTVQLTKTDVVCVGGSDGSITAVAGGGDQNYSYQLNGGAWSTSNVFSGLAAGVYTVTVKDGSGCSESAQITVAQKDVLKPMAVAKNITIALNAQGNAQITADDVNNGSYDNCGITSISIDKNVFGCGNTGVNKVILTVRDAAGNTATAEAFVTVKDVTAPVIACPGDVTVNNDPNKCAANVVIPSFTVNDECAGAVSNTETFEEYSAGNVNGRSPLWKLWDGPGVTSALVSSERVFSGNYSLKVTGAPAGGPVDQLYLLGNQTAGKWTVSFKMYVPAGKTAYYNMQHNEIPGTWAHQVIFRSNGAGFLNAVGLNIPFNYPQEQWFEVKQDIDQTNDVTTLYINGVAIRTWKFSLNTGNQQAENKIGSFDFFPVTWAGDVNPSATPLFYVDDIKMQGSTAGVAAFTARRYSKSYPVGVTPVKMTIADEAGNEASCNLTVTVNDVQKPNVTPGADITVRNDAGKCGANVTIPGPAVSDNCGIKSVVVSKAGFFPVGTTTITWTVTDIHNNVSTATQNITVEDKEAPSITAPAAVNVANTPGICGNNAVALGTPVTGDNCGVASVSNDAPSVFPVGSTTVTWTVTDVHGNTNTATQTVTVTDTEAPKVVTQNINATLVNGTVSITAAQVDNGSSDNCGIASMSVSPSTWSCGTYGPQTVTLTVTDIHGNSSSAPATVNVIGNTPAVSIGVSRSDNTFTGLGANTIALGYGAQKLTLTATNANSGTAGYSWTPSAGLSSTTTANPVFAPTAAGTYTYTVKVTNIYGCSSTATVTLIVMDVRCGNNGDKVIVCQVPPGNPGNPQTICIAPSAVATHLNKGSYLGNCRVPSANSRGSETVSSSSAVSKEDMLLKYDGKITLEITPNPTNGIFTARLYNAAMGRARVEVIGMNGNVVEVKNAEVTQSLTNIAFNLSAKSQGMYKVRAVDAKGKTTTVTILVQR